MASDAGLCARPCPTQGRATACRALDTRRSDRSYLAAVSQGSIASVLAICTNALLHVGPEARTDLTMAEESFPDRRRDLCHGAASRGKPRSRPTPDVQATQRQQRPDEGAFCV